MNADGVRGICGRCVFRGGTFRTQNALQIPVGQYDCGRCAAQKETFRKRVGDLPQTGDTPSAKGRICLAALGTSDVPPRETKGSGGSRSFFRCPGPYESELSTARTSKKAPHLRATPFVSTGGGSRIRTGDPMLAKHVLYQLSYTPINKFGDAGVP